MDDLVMSSGEHLVAQGLQLIKVENDSMLAVAVQRPRDEAKIIAGALAELNLVPEQAKAAYYEIPYRERQEDGGYKVTKVSGPSIKAAMALVRRWGNCSVTCRIISEDLDGFNLEGIYLDLESNYRLSRPMRVGKSYKSRSKKVIELDPKRLEMAVQAGASKAIRNATLAGLPAYLVGAYDQRAREITGGKLDQVADPKTVQAIIRAFTKLKVTQAQLEVYVDDLPMSQWTGNEVASLRGIWNAITDGQMAVEEAFPVAVEDDLAGGGIPGTGAAGKAVITPDSLLSAVVTGQNDAQKLPVDVAQGDAATENLTSVDLDASDPPEVMVGPDGLVGADGEAILRARADRYGNLILLAKIQGSSPGFTAGQYRYAWVEVGSKKSKVSVP